MPTAAIHSGGRARARHRGRILPNHDPPRRASPTARTSGGERTEGQRETGQPDERDGELDQRTHPAKEALELGIPDVHALRDHAAASSLVIQPSSSVTTLVATSATNRWSWVAAMRHAPSSRCSREDLEQRLVAVPVLPERRLVEDEHGGPADEHARQRQAALLAARQAIWAAASECLERQVEALHQSAGHGPVSSAVSPSATSSAHRLGQELALRLLEYVARSARQRRPPAAATASAPPSRTVPVVRPEQPDEQPREGRLAAAVRADQRDPLARPDRRLDVAHDRATIGHSRIGRPSRGRRRSARRDAACRRARAAPRRRRSAPGSQMPASRIASAGPRPPPRRAARRRSAGPSPSSASTRSASGQALRRGARSGRSSPSGRRGSRPERSTRAAAPTGSRFAVGSSRTSRPGRARARRPARVAAAGRRRGAATAVARGLEPDRRRAPPAPGRASPPAASRGSRGRTPRRPRPVP